MIIRDVCIFCRAKLTRTFFEHDLENYTGHYAVEVDDTASVKIPYNVCICDNCNTPQTKYLGDLAEIYRINHADSTGKVMQALHDCVLDVVSQYKDRISGIIEIGGAKGVLADKILDRWSVPYTIIDPAYFGNDGCRLIIKDLYENVDDAGLDANTVVMSHVFEHFYEPLKILQKIADNPKIEHVFLVFPNLEAYIQANILHVLNIEHTFYVDNEFLERVFAQHGFVVRQKTLYDKHSVVFHFERDGDRSCHLGQNKHDLVAFFGKIQQTVNRFNDILVASDKNVYLFPASIHSIFLTIMGLRYDRLTAMIDNSPLKINKKLYGLNVPIRAFGSVFEDKNALVLLNGGVFNQEVTDSLKRGGVDYVCS